MEEHHAMYLDRLRQMSSPPVLVSCSIGDPVGSGEVSEGVCRLVIHGDRRGFDELATFGHGWSRGIFHWSIQAGLGPSRPGLAPERIAPQRDANRHPWAAA